MNQEKFSANEVADLLRPELIAFKKALIKLHPKKKQSINLYFLRKLDELPLRILEKYGRILLEKDFQDSKFFKNNSWIFEKPNLLK